MPARRLRAHLALVVMVAVWSGAIVGVKAALDTGLDALDLVILRTLLAAPFFAGLAWIRRPLGLTRADAARLVVAGVLGMAVYQAALNLGTDRSSADTVTLAMAATPALTLLMARAVGLERLTAARVGGIATALGGVVVAIVASPADGGGTTRLAGAILIAIAAVSWAAYTVLMKPLLERGDSVGVTALSSLVGSVAILPFATSHTVDAATNLTARQGWLLLYLAVAITIVGYLAWNEGVRGLDSSRASVYLYLTTPASLALATVLLDEPFTLGIALSAALVLCGVAIAQRG
jgi:drug/metabolite transporter (DMT)-like permease